MVDLSVVTDPVSEGWVEPSFSSTAWSGPVVDPASGVEVVMSLVGVVATAFPAFQAGGVGGESIVYSDDAMMDTGEGSAGCFMVAGHGKSDVWTGNTELLLIHGQVFLSGSSR